MLADNLPRAGDRLLLSRCAWKWRWLCWKGRRGLRWRGIGRLGLRRKRRRWFWLLERCWLRRKGRLRLSDWRRWLLYIESRRWRERKAHLWRWLQCCRAERLWLWFCPG